MRILAVLVFGASVWMPPVFSQPAPPVRILKGELIEWEVRGLAGEFSVRGIDSRVDRCRLLPDTYIARELMRVTPVGVRTGDTVEVVADFHEGPSRCMAVTIYVRPPAEVKRRLTGADHPLRSTYTLGLLEGLWVRGPLVYTGIVSRVDERQMVVRTRTQGEKTFHVRDDTTFSDAGRLVEPEELPIYQRVFIRARMGIEGGLEATAVAWGEILRPER